MSCTRPTYIKPAPPVIRMFLISLRGSNFVVPMSCRDSRMLGSSPCIEEALEFEFAGVTLETLIVLVAVVFVAQAGYAKVRS